jgi:hypothetical protein
VTRYDIALEVNEGVIEECDAILTPRVAHTVESIALRVGEATRQRLLRR